MKKIIVVLFCLHAFSITQAQNYSGKGYIITNSHDTLSGIIHYNSRSIDNNSFTFQKENTIEKVRLTTEQCDQFVLLSPKTEFRRYVVSKYLGYQNKLTLDLEFVDSMVTETVFLRMVYNGKIVSLLQQFHFRDHFFILDKEKNTIEDLLIIYVPYSARFVAEDGYRNASFKIKTPYRNQLLAYINPINNKKARNLLDKCKYEEKDLVNIIKIIDDGNEESKKNNSQKKSRY